MSLREIDMFHLRVLRQWRKVTGKYPILNRLQSFGASRVECQTALFNACDISWYITSVSQFITSKLYLHVKITVVALIP